MSSVPFDSEWIVWKRNRFRLKKWRCLISPFRHWKYLLSVRWLSAYEPDEISSLHIWTYITATGVNDLLCYSLEVNALKCACNAISSSNMVTAFEGSWAHFHGTLLRAHIHNDVLNELMSTVFCWCTVMFRCYLVTLCGCIWKLLHPVCGSAFNSDRAEVDYKSLARSQAPPDVSEPLLMPCCPESDRGLYPGKFSSFNVQHSAWKSYAFEPDEKQMNICGADLSAILSRFTQTEKLLFNGGNISVLWTCGCSGSVAFSLWG